MRECIGKKFIVVNKVVELVDIQGDEVICNTWDIDLKDMKTDKFNMGYFEGMKNLLSGLELKGL